LYAVQAGAFADMTRAEALRDALAARLPVSTPVRLIRTGGGTGGESAGAPALWHVLAGSGLSLEEATALAPDVRKTAGAALIVRDFLVGDKIAPDPPVGERP
jgi:hypothetical protein